MLIEKLQAPPAGPLAAGELASMDAWWRAANYLSVGQVYLLANPRHARGARLALARSGARLMRPACLRVRSPGQEHWRELPWPAT